MRNMRSKVILLLCLSFAFAMMIASEVAAARDLAETSVGTSNELQNVEGTEESKYRGGGYGGYPGGGYGGGGYGGYPGGGRGGHGGHGGYGGGCRYGCCGRGYHGRGCRCCSYAGEAVDAEP